ncbi:hypothetical protein H4582DRAFT_790642 [Lactarius indigo]|nr:hypothetical protein H4582DRAFT_790642 [Lactarius indigo]
MHDSPSSPRRSIAPAPPKQHQPKKAGAPKAKGAVRAKSGCYTCRIRRKKCDERPNAEGRCETCIRLRLQCLGFGQKRPDWLKENNNVTMFREKIKDFLAAQGMIKGHSGSGTRSSDQEGMLVLVTDHGRSDTSSPILRPYPLTRARTADIVVITFPVSVTIHITLPFLSLLSTHTPVTLLSSSVCRSRPRGSRLR